MDAVDREGVFDDPDEWIIQVRRLLGSEYILVPELQVTLWGLS